MRYKIREMQQERLAPYTALHLEKNGREMPTLWTVDRRNELQEIGELKETLEKKKASYLEARDRLPQLTEAIFPFLTISSSPNTTLNTRKMRPCELKPKKNMKRLF